jgi:hypothetical protein
MGRVRLGGVYSEVVAAAWGLLLLMWSQSMEDCEEENMTEAEMQAGQQQQ